MVASSANECCGTVEDPDYETLPEGAGMAAHCVAGALAGIIEHTVMFPLDALKTRIQMLGPILAQVSPQPAVAAAALPQQPLATGTVQALTRIWSTEGMAALWRGVGSVVVGAGPAHALYFASYEYFKAMAPGAKGGISGEIAPMWAAGAGAIATVVQDAVMTPFDVVKQRMQAVTGGQYRNMLHCARRVMNKEGPRAFYAAYPTTLAMSVPYQATHFAAYEAMVTALNPSRKYDPITHVIAGGVAGGLAAAATTPLDVAKTVLQTRGDSPDLAVQRVRGLFDAARLVYARHGIAGFARGLTPRVLSHMPATAVCWTTYEYFKFMLALHPPPN